MEKRAIEQNLIDGFRSFLMSEEKSAATVEKYIRDVTAFAEYASGTELSKETVIAYKQKLIQNGYATRSINSMLASLNSLFVYAGWMEMKVKALKLQQQAFCAEEKELTRGEYERLCMAAKRKRRESLFLILQTICSTGIRVSELAYITAEAVRKGKAEVYLKGKIRTVLLPTALRKKLQRYLSRRQIKEGPVFLSRSGKPLNRSVIWREMKSLCAEASVNPGKVFPHNLRHLFARVFYNLEKDIVKLADVLGHSSVETTRIYIISSGLEHRQRMERMHLVI